MPDMTVEEALAWADKDIHYCDDIQGLKDATDALAAEVRRLQAETGGPCTTCWRAHPRHGTPDDVLYCGLVSQETSVPLPCSYFKFGCRAWEAKT